MTTKEVKAKLHTYTVSKNKAGNFIVRKEFFYTMGKTAQDLQERVLAAFPQANIIKAMEIWKPFRGGASISKQSHWYVEFNFDNPINKQL